MQPLVSICIPTYNRAECLKKTVESIIIQPEFKRGEVEIVVSDNASTDSTSSVCSQYKKYDNFFYHKNMENIMDKNYPMVLSEAHGKLRKLNNDTFILSKGSLKKLCDLVRKYDETRPFIFLCNKNDKVKEKKLNFHDFVVDIGYLITWLASFTIWEDECDQIKSDIYGCDFRLWQVRKAYEVACKKNLVVLSYQKFGISITPPKKDISYGLYKIFYCNYMKLLQPYVDNGIMKKKDIECIEKELLLKFFSAWLVPYELNNTDLQYSKEENLKDAVRNQYKDKQYWNEFEKIYKKKLLIARFKLFIKRVIGKA